MKSPILLQGETFRVREATARTNLGSSGARRALLVQARQSGTGEWQTVVAIDSDGMVYAQGSFLGLDFTSSTYADWNP